MERRSAGRPRRTSGFFRVPSNSSTVVEHDLVGQTVDAEVWPLPGGGPVRRGPYRFGGAAEAFQFVQEALLALRYLGCAVT